MRKNLTLFGAGGHCASVIDVVESSSEWQLIRVVDKQASPNLLLGYEVVGEDEALLESSDTDWAIVAVGQIRSSNARRRLYTKMTEVGWNAATVISATATVSSHAYVGCGSIVMHGAVVNSRALVGENVIVNTLALIEHDAVIGDHCHVSTGAKINGEAVVGEGSFIGSGTVVGNGVRIGKGCVIGAGSLVMRDVPAGTLKRGGNFE